MRPDGSIGSMLQVVAILLAGDEISTRKLIERLGLTPATAKRYMTQVEVYLPVEMRTECRVRFIRLRGRHGQRRSLLQEDNIMHD